MKKYSLFLTAVFCVMFCAAQQGFGFGIGIATTKAPFIYGKYYFNKNAVSVGVSDQIFNNALGKKEDGVIAGTMAIGNGRYFYSVDLGYTRILSEHFAIEGELSFGSKKYYQNLSDNSFSQGGYHRIYDSKSVVGGGVFLIYKINDNVGIFAGYNSIRQASIGVQFSFLRDE